MQRKRPISLTQTKILAYDSPPHLSQASSLSQKALPSTNSSTKQQVSPSKPSSLKPLVIDPFDDDILDFKLPKRAPKPITKRSRVSENDSSSPQVLTTEATSTPKVKKVENQKSALDDIFSSPEIVAVSLPKIRPGIVIECKFIQL